MLAAAGWSEISVEPIGGPWTAWDSVHPVVSRSRIVRVLLAPYIRLADRLAGKKSMTYAWLAFGKKPSG